MSILKYVLTTGGDKPTILESGINGLIQDISQLSHSTKEGQVLVFRGQPDSNFKLIPSAFRPDKIAEVKRVFPIPSPEVWCHDEKFRENVKGLAIYSFDQLMMQEPFRRLLEITFYVMQYNYHLGTSPQFNQKILDSRSQEINKLRPPSNWIESRTFHDFFYRNLQNALTFIGEDRRISKYAYFEEIFTGLDESFPQHYGFSTTGLDWSYNPRISLHFATEGIPEKATHFSVFACKFLNAGTRNPLLITPANPEIENPRIRNQEGVLMRIQSAWEFYFNYGVWPSVENYLLASQGNFELIKYEIPVSYKEECRRLLNSIGITHEFLFPD